MKQSKKLSFAVHPVRIDAGAQGQRRGFRRGGVREDAGRETLIPFKRNKMHIGPDGQKMQNALFILLSREGAGGIKKRAAGTEHIGGGGQKIFLNTGQLVRLSGTPVLKKRLVFPEHSFSRAGSVQKDPVKKAGILIPEPSGRFIGNKCIDSAAHFKITEKDLCPGSADIVGHKQPLSLQTVRRGAGFPAGRRTQIEHPVSGPYGKP